MKMDNTTVIGISGALLGAAGIGFAIGQRSNAKVISEKLDRTISEIYDSTDIELSDAIIEKAVERAVEREAEMSAKRAVQKVADDIHSSVKQAVDDEYYNIRKSVKSEVENRVSRIDIDDVKSEIIRQAKDDISHKLDSNLDSILGEYKESLKHIGKIYKAASDAFTGSDGTKEIKLRIS